MTNLELIVLVIFATRYAWKGLQAVLDELAAPDPDVDHEALRDALRPGAMLHVRQSNLVEYIWPEDDAGDDPVRLILNTEITPWEEVLGIKEGRDPNSRYSNRNET